VTKTHEVEENGSTFFNNFVRFYLGKVPFVRGNRIADVVPSFNGMSNNNNLTTQVQSNKQVRYTDSITCQVMQVLPNGHLIIQGKKAVQMNKELSDLYVTGIVNPYYIDRNNSIKSRQVGNLQFLMAGKGVISRQQNDGVVSKLNQFFN
jgi:flagellar L-ring protein precursor FlgH